MKAVLKNNMPLLLGFEKIDLPAIRNGDILLDFSKGITNFP